MNVKMNVKMQWKQIAAVGFLALALGGTLSAAGKEPVDLSADVLEYDSATERMTASGAVRVKQGAAVVTGARAEYDSKAETGYLSGGVTLDKEDIHMRAAQVRLLSRTRAVAEGGVVLTQGDRVLTGPRVDYDMEKGVATVDSDARIVTPEGTIAAGHMEFYTAENKVLAGGGVHIVSETNQLDATSESAVYYAAEKGKLVLTGDPVATQNGNTLRGKTLTLYLAGQTVKAAES